MEQSPPAESRIATFFQRENPDDPKSSLIPGSISLPKEYTPDLDDKHFRPESIPDGAFHSIGKGSQAIVFAACFKKENIEARVAAKRFDIDELERANDNYTGFTFLLREIQNTMFLSLTHPNIVKMMDCFYQNWPTGEPRYVWLTTERMDCSLQFYFDLLSKPDKNGRSKLRDHRHLASLFVQLFRALDFLHLRGIMHRDVTPKNIGMNRKNFEIKLLDFGVSGKINSNGEVTRVVSTPITYQPLEMILEKGYDTGVDVWAVGLVGLHLLGKKLTYPYGNERRLDAVKQRILDVVGLPEDRYQQIFGDCLSGELLRPSTLSSEIDRAMRFLEPDREVLCKKNLKDLLEKIFTVNRMARPRPAECLKMPYLKLVDEKLTPIDLHPDQMQERNTRDKDILKQMLLKFSRKTE